MGINLRLTAPVDKNSLVFITKYQLLNIAWYEVVSESSETTSIACQW